MSISGISTAARGAALVRSLGERQAEIDRLSNQLATGKKGRTFGDYGAEAQRLLSLRSEHARRASHMAGIDLVQPTLKATDLALGRVETVLSDLFKDAAMPTTPGPASVTVPRNADAATLKVRVPPGESRFLRGGEFAVVSEPSTSKPGWFDVTLTDGLGGRSTLTLPPVPAGASPASATFAIAGGSGSGSKVTLSFERLAGASDSGFSVSYPAADRMRETAEKAMQAVRGYLNERYGDRHLFGGSRLQQAPVGDPVADPLDFSAANRAQTVVTFPGDRTGPADTMTVDIGGRTFSHTMAPADPKTPDFAAQSLAAQIAAAAPPVPVAASVENGSLKLVHLTPGAAPKVAAATVGAPGAPQPTVVALPPGADGAPAPGVVSAPDLPYYDARRTAASTQDPSAWQRMALHVADDQQQSYGVTSTDPAVQRVFGALRQMRAAALRPGDYEAMAADGRTMLSGALDGLRDLRARNGSDMASLDGKRKWHREASDAIEEGLARIENVDRNEVAVRLAEAMNNQQAAYAALAKVMKLNLVDYLA